jgi:uncharacterized membrane protein (GlpM family)
MNRLDLILEFALGGMAVALCHELSILLSWKMIGGIFAAFPAVMVVSVALSGISHGNEKAGQVAQGAVYGMVGGVICVIAVLLALQHNVNWWLSILVGIVAWCISAVLVLRGADHVNSESRRKSLHQPRA